MNDFEKYLKKNKKRFQLKEVNPDIWSAIERGVGEKKRGRRISLYRKLAAVAAVLFISFTLHQIYFTKQTMNIPEALLASYGFDDPNVDKMLEIKVQTIKATAIPASYKDDLQALLSQVNYLDRRFESQLTYLKERQYEEDIAKEVLKYYKAKSGLLDKVISEIQKINNNEKEYNIKSKRTYIEL